MGKPVPPFLLSGEKMEQFVEMDYRIGQNIDGLFIKKYQDIPKEFLDRNREMRDLSAANTAGEYHQMASVPEAVVDAWLRQGFDVYRESTKSILARLKAEGLDYFITSNKRL